MSENEEEIELRGELEELGISDDSDIAELLTPTQTPQTPIINTTRRRTYNSHSRSRSRQPCLVDNCEWNDHDTLPDSQLEPDLWELTDQQKEHIAKHHIELHIRLQNYEADKKIESINNVKSQDELVKKYSNFEDAMFDHKNGIVISGFLRKYVNNNNTIPSVIVYVISLMYENLHNLILMIGNSNVGKTSLLNRYINNTFKFDVKPTEFDIVVNDRNKEKVIIFCDLSGNAQIFDQQMNKFHSHGIALNISGLIFVYDINNNSSFESIEQWKIKIFGAYKDNMREEIIPMLLMGNKCDWNEELRQVLTKNGQQYGVKNTMFFYEVSAKTDLNVNDAFDSIQ